jgi:hypothetical protein
MFTIHLTDKELETARQGMTAFLHNFSHDQADTVLAIRSVLDRLAEAKPEKDAPAASG